MSDPKVSAKNGSIAVGGDVSGTLLNFNAETINVDIQQKSELSSFLGQVIVSFSQQSISEYGTGGRRPVPPEVKVKIKHNNLAPNHRLLMDWTWHELLLEQVYLGVEQENPEARYLVKRKAAVVYESLLVDVPPEERIDYVRSNASALVYNVVDLLLENYKNSGNIKVAEEIAHLAISVIVADAIVECEVLERPEDVITA